MPAYNEEKGLRTAVEQTRETCLLLGLPYEIIIVDDCSLDRTGEVARSLAAVHKELVYLCHEHNQGVGGAVRTGIQAAKGAFILFIPVDNPLTDKEVQPFLSRMSQSDIVLGVRPERVGYPMIPRFASYVYNRVLVPLLFGIRFRDINWIQMWRRQPFDEGILQIQCKGMMFLLELLVRAKRHNLRIEEVSLPMKKRVHGKATCFKLSFMWRTFWEMLRFLRTSRGW